MSRYIDADMLLRILETDEEYNKDNPQRVDGIIDAVQEIIAMPTADVVEVVRCKDCKHYKIDHPRANGYHCCYRMHSIFPMKPDGFCSYGEVCAVNILVYTATEPENYCGYGERKILPKD